MISPMELYNQKLSMVQELYISKVGGAGLKVPDFASQYKVAKTGQAELLSQLLTTTQTTGTETNELLTQLLGNRTASYLPGFGTGVNAVGSLPVSLTKAADFADMVNEMSEKYSVPASLINAMIQAESSFNPNSVSATGAQGLMQLMPGTAGDMGVTNPFNAKENLEGGVKYLRKQLDRFGDVRLALAAYNYGPNRVSKLGISDVNQLSEYNKLPEHLQKYIEKILCYEKQFAKGGA